MQLVKLEDLRIGDEIIIGAGSKLKYLKLLKEPTQVMKKFGVEIYAPLNKLYLGMK